MKRLFRKIVRAIPDGIFASPESLNEAAIDIFLTATNVRPACIPFDGDEKSSADEMIAQLVASPKILDNLRSIPGIDVRVGPYYDVGTAIVVFNQFAEVHMRKLERIAMRYGDSRAVKAPDIHVLMGKLLGYPCPEDIRTLYGNKVWSIQYVIDGRPHMSVWCPILIGGRSSKDIDASLELLNRINDALETIGKSASMTVAIAKV